MIGRKRMWKLVTTITGMLGAMVAQRFIKAGYKATRKDTDPATPFDPTKAGFSWPDALVWAAAGGIGLGIAKVVSARLAAIGWEAATHTLPPGVEEPAAV